jgi:hypothetical protein
MFQQHGFSTTAGSNDGGDLSGSKLQVHAAEDFLTVKAFMQIDNLYHQVTA